MMSKNKKILCALIISLLFVFSGSEGGARMATSAVGGKGAPPANETQVTKSSQFVKTIANNVLYLEGNKSYALDKVNVIDLTGKRRISGKKKLADLTFVNGVLKEVILR
jgi:hypothetical protein